MAFQFNQYFTTLSFEQRVVLMQALGNAPTQKVIVGIIDDVQRLMAELPAPSGNPATDASFVASYLDLRRVKDLLQTLQNVCQRTQEEFLQKTGNQSEEY